MKAVKVITDPKLFELLGDETRRRIIYILRAKEMTVSQIAEELHFTTQAIYHHIRKLKDAEMVEVAREERVGHFIETYYSATAEVFHLAHGKETSQKDSETQLALALDGMAKLGFKVKKDKESIRRIVKAARDMDKCCNLKELTEKVTKIEDVDFVTGQAIVEYASLLAMDDREFEEHIRKYEEFRKVLKTYVENPPEMSSKGKDRKRR